MLAWLAKDRGTPVVRIPVVAMVMVSVSQDLLLPQGMDFPPPAGLWDGDLGG